jgi:lysozyme
MNEATLPDPNQNPAPPAGWRYMPQPAVTPAMTAWAIKLLEDLSDYPGPPPYWVVPNVVDGRVVRAMVQVHPPDKENGAVHRGVSLMEPTPPGSIVPAEGFDLSHYQGQGVDFGKARASGRRFAIAKASEGTALQDDTFQRNFKAAKEAGLWRGAYHFFHPIEDPGKQADCFLRALAQAGSPGDLLPVADVETLVGAPRGLLGIPTPHLDAVRAYLSLSAPNLLQNLLQFLQTIGKATGLQPMIYTSPGFWNLLPGGSLRDQCAAIARLWVAHWGVPTPTVPTGWKEWLFWQRSASEDVPGVPGPDDADVFNGNAEDLDRWVGTHVYVPNPPAPVPPPAPTPRPAPDLATMSGCQIALSYLAVKLHDPTLDPGGVDGIEGPKTDAALRSFQARVGISDFGPRTRAALQVALDKARQGA